MSNGDTGVPIEQFIQALQTQLDRAQTAMAIKAENLDLPLTFAVKELSLDLRTHVEVVRSEVRIRPAGSGDRDTSTLHLALTTITRPMIRENAATPLNVDPDEPTLKEAVGDQLSDEEQKRLEWAGVHTVAQLRKLTDSGAGKEVERVADLPVNRLRQALARASQPLMTSVETHVDPNASETDIDQFLRIRGRNLKGPGLPRVSIGGHPVNVVKATHREILIAPEAHHQLSGTLSIETEPGQVAEMPIDLASAFRRRQQSDSNDATVDPANGGQP